MARNQNALPGLLGLLPSSRRATYPLGNAAVRAGRVLITAYLELHMCYMSARSHTQCNPSTHGGSRGIPHLSKTALVTLFVIPLAHFPRPRCSPTTATALWSVAEGTGPEGSRRCYQVVLTARRLPNGDAPPIRLSVASGSISYLVQGRKRGYILQLFLFGNEKEQAGCI